MKILFYETEDWQIPYLKQRFAAHELAFVDSGHIDPQAEIVSNFVGSRLTRQMVEAMPNLKFVATRSTGYDHIDLAACNDRGILVSNVPAYGENTVAEFTFALLLALSRKIFQSAKQVREQGLFSTAELQGFDLKGKTMGIVGTGHIGSCAIKIAKGFAMNVLAYDPFPNARSAAELGYVYVSLEELLQRSDVVSLHVPYMPQTHHLLNEERLRLCKPGAVLVNTARGGLVDTAALVAALKSGRLAGAALDVLEEEGFLKDEMELVGHDHPGEERLKTVLADHELMYMENVLVTPHNAFNTVEAMHRILETSSSNVEAFIAGKPQNLVK